MSTTKSATLPVMLLFVLLFVLLLVGLGANEWTQWREEAADYSAHAALTKEIFEQLAATPPGHYPETLGQLPLTFRDGGDQSMLERFGYTSYGTSCLIFTVLGENVIEQSFP